MNKIAGISLKALIGAAAGTLIAGHASAADLAMPEPIVEAAAPTLIDVAFGVAGVSDYVFRGISQTHGKLAIQGYAEVQAFDYVYAGVWSSSVNDFATNPTAEVDIYGGLRHTWDAFSLDVGGLYYYYPGENAGPGIRELDYYEVFAKPGFSFGDFGSVTGNFYYTKDFFNVSGDGYYLSVIPKVNIPVSAFPDLSFYASGELGKQWVKNERFGAVLPDYLTWNIGAGVTYKAITVDLRYSDTDLKRGECLGYSGFAKVCDERFMVKVAFDTALSKLK